tara:strand:+ start:970 stop:1152 length:183 start_codon:yes stop_codon:yes gene_type:complete
MKPNKQKQSNLSKALKKVSKLDISKEAKLQIYDIMYNLSCNEFNKGYDQATQTAKRIYTN